MKLLLRILCWIVISPLLGLVMLCVSPFILIYGSVGSLIAITNYAIDGEWKWPKLY